LSAVIDPKVDMYLQGTWLDVTADIRQKPPIKITGGSKSEASKISPGRCTFVANNENGNYNPRNPMGTYFGELGKNTPVRVRVPMRTDDVSQTDTDGWGTNWTNGPSDGGTVANTDWTRSGTVNTHHIPVDDAHRRSLLNGNEVMDGCVRFNVTLPTDNITDAQVQTEIGFRYLDVDNYIAVRYIFDTQENVRIQIVELIDGVERTLYRSTIVAPGELSVVDDQVFEVAALIEGQVVRAKIWATGSPEPIDWEATVTRATIRYGKVTLTSTVENNNTNTKPFNFDYDDFVVEARPFVGEINNFVPKVSDESHAAPYVEITASGVTQRTQQGSEPLKSTMFRWWSSAQRWVREGAALSTESVGSVNVFTATDADVADVAAGNTFYILPNAVRRVPAVEDHLFTIISKVSAGGFTDINFTPDALSPIELGNELHSFRLATATDGPVVYWPCEDEKSATSVTSGLLGGYPMVQLVGTPEFAASDVFLGSAPILKLNDTELRGDVPTYDDTNQAFTINFFVHFPAADEAATGQSIIDIYTTGTATIYIQYTGGGDGNVRVMAYDILTGVQLFTTTLNLGTEGLRDLPSMITFTLRQTNPTTVQFTFATNSFFSGGGGGIAVFAPITLTGVTTLGRVTTLRANPEGGYDDVAFGHLGGMPKGLEYYNLLDPPEAGGGESVMLRMERLAYEEDIPFVYCQGPVSGEVLGEQTQVTLLTNLENVVATDMGRFYESRGAYSFEYRQRSTLDNQPYFMEIDYSAGGVLSELVPTDDDKDTRNDITVKKEGGSTYRTTLETGRLSVQRPEDGGVGRYTSAPTVVPRLNSGLNDIGEWQLHLGTVDEERYSSIKVTPTDSAITLEEFFSAGVGNRFKLTDMEDRDIFEPVDQLVVGYTLVLHPVKPTLDLTSEPSSPYNIVILNDNDIRLDSSDSSLSAGINNVAATFDVTTPEPLTRWVVAADEILTGEAIAQGTSLTANYFIATDDAAAPINVGDEMYLYTSVGVLKEATQFTVTGKVDAGGGLINVQFSPNSAVVPATGDILRSHFALNFPFDIMVGGERMTCTGITGTGDPQSFTVTRSVNGVVKSHLSGVQVQLADPYYIAK
jgi:hypothetical protein